MRQSKQNAQQQAVPERSRREPATRERPRTGWRRCTAPGQPRGRRVVERRPPPPPAWIDSVAPATASADGQPARHRLPARRCDAGAHGAALRPRFRRGEAAHGQCRRRDGAHGRRTGLHGGEDIILLPRRPNACSPMSWRTSCSRRKRPAPGAAAYAHAEAEAARAARRGGAGRRRWALRRGRCRHRTRRRQSGGIGSGFWKRLAVSSSMTQPMGRSLWTSC